jgi:exopolysaccharide transport family protein
MSKEKPVHVPRHRYPELTYPRVMQPEIPSPGGTGNGEEDSIHLLDYWRLIVARRWTVIAVLFTVTALTLLWTFKQTPIYEARVALQIDRENPNILTFKDVYEVETSTDDTLRTQFEVLKSRSVARRVIEEMSLDDNPEFKQSDVAGLGRYIAYVRSFFPRTTPPNSEPDRLRPIIDEYLLRLSVTPVRLARIVAVTFESEDPVLAARVINAHAENFIEQNFQYKWEATQKASVFLKEQLTTLQSNLEKAEDRLQAYSRENQILFTEQGRNTAIERLQQLEEQFTEAQADRFNKESFDTLIRVGKTDDLPQVLSNELITGLRTRLTELQREDSELGVTFAPDYPRRKRTRSQIEQIEKTIATEMGRIIRTVQAEYAAAVERERLLAEETERQREVVNRINEQIIQYNIIKREVDSDKQLYEGLLTRLNEAGVSAELRASNIRVVDRAEVPDRPVRPRKALNLALGLVLGLVCGVGLAFFREYMDNTIKTSEDITHFLNVPTLGLVPNLASLDSRRAYGRYLAPSARKSSNGVALQAGKPRIDLISHESPTSLIAEAYRSIRTSLLLSSSDHPPRSVLITSARPSEGKTVTAVNIAISLTQTGARVVLVDADMRKPRIHTVFGMNVPVGLSSVLTGTAPVKSAIQESAVPNLFILTCGPIPPNPGELIVAERFKKLIQVLPQYFDYVILDSPPVSNVSDARILASMCDATVIVVKALTTPRHQGRDAVDQLRESRGRIAGAVLNDLDVRVAGSYYSYYYSKYSYSSYSSDSPKATS